MFFTLQLTPGSSFIMRALVIFLFVHLLFPASFARAERSVFSFPASAGAAINGFPATFLQDAGFSVPAPQAMGNRESEALAPRGTPQPSATEQMLSGTMVGAAVFGYPYQGIGTVDIVIMVLLAYLLFRSFAARKPQQDDDAFTVNRRDGLNRDERQKLDDTPRQRTRVDELRPNAPGRETPHSDKPGPPAEGASPQGEPRDNAWSRRLRGEPDKRSAQAPNRRPANVQENAANMWAALRSQEKRQDQPETAVAEGAHLPPGFDVNDFLEGARTLYVRLQQSWASRQLDGLAPFATENMMALLRKQAAKTPDPTPIDILLVNATLTDVEQLQGLEQASVLFNVTMRAGDAGQPEEISEIWKFVRGSDTNGMWQLAGITSA